MFELRMKRLLAEMDKASKIVGCPEEEVLAGFLERTLPDEEYGHVAAHLADCPACLDQVLIAEEIEAVGAPSRHHDRVDVLIRFVREAVELFHGHDLIQPVPVSVFHGARGRKVPAPHTARFIREFDDVNAEVEVERFREGRGEIRVKTSRDRRLLDKVRVTLIQGNKEVASYLTESGRVLFEDVSFGGYTLRLRKNGAFIGDITIQIREEL